MFFSFLAHLPTEQQNKIMENWNTMRKQQEEKQKLVNLERMRLEKERLEFNRKRQAEIKKREEQEKFMEMVRKNPPKTFKDMMIVGPFMAEYYKNKKMLDKSTQISENKSYTDGESQYDEADVNPKSWFSW